MSHALVVRIHTCYLNWRKFYLTFSTCCIILNCKDDLWNQYGQTAARYLSCFVYVHGTALPRYKIISAVLVAPTTICLYTTRWWSVTAPALAMGREHFKLVTLSTVNTQLSQSLQLHGDILLRPSSLGLRAPYYIGDVQFYCPVSSLPVEWPICVRRRLARCRI